MPDLDPSGVADAIHRQISALDDQSAAPVRVVRREWSRRLRSAPADDVLAVADALVPRQRWVAYELVDGHRGARAALDLAWVERLGRGIDSWVAVDTFGRFISGMAWQRRQIADEAVERWAALADRWWRRAALVSTVPLNLRAAGGTGDTQRTLRVCRLLVADRDDMVVKAMSWALRQLVVWDAGAVRSFIETENVAARVRREVTTKLETGHKNRPRSAARSFEG
jgi:3-methyladenine DNA glycosylase AlkD